MDYMDMDEEHTITLNLGSSPDPLLDPILSPPMLPPSRIKKMPQPAAQLLSIARSPRKQMFELDIGNDELPQRLFVTVEAGENGTIQNNNRNIKRRLFQSPTPTPSRPTPGRRAMSQIKNNAVTTTTVPLHGLSDDERATPKKRGRPRKSGTPVPNMRKRQGTPGRVGRPPRASASPHKDFPTSDLGFEDVDATPRARPAAQSPRKSTKRKTMSPSKGDGANDGQPPRKRGRPRKSEVTASIAEMLSQANSADTRAQNNPPIERAEEPTLPTERRQVAAEISGDHGGDDFEDDIWLNTVSDQPAPPATYRWQQDNQHSPSPRRQAQPELEPTSDSRFHDEEEWPEMGDGPADDYSEGGSIRSQSQDRDDRQDTVMANEDFTNFTRISISELPSMQMNSSVMAHQHQEEDFGEETSLIIERTMDYLRQSRSKAVDVPEQLPEEVSYPQLPQAERRPMVRTQTRFLPSDGPDELGEEPVEEYRDRSQQHEEQHTEERVEQNDQEVEEHVDERFHMHGKQQIEAHVERHDEGDVEDRFQSHQEHLESRLEEHETYIEEHVQGSLERRQERATDRFDERREHVDVQVEEYGDEREEEHVKDHTEEPYESHVEEPVGELMKGNSEQLFEDRLQHHEQHGLGDHGEQDLENHDEDHFEGHAQHPAEAHSGYGVENYNEPRFEEHVGNNDEEQTETEVNQDRRETTEEIQEADQARIEPPTTFQPPQEPPPQGSPGAWWNQAPKRPKRKKQPLSKTVGLKALLEEANAREAAQGPSTSQELDVSGYDDSFSTIPESVLIAATPRKPLRLPVENEEAEEADAQVDEIPSEEIQPSIERQSTVNPSIPQSETNRLLTPDETSSPIPPEDGEPQPEPELSGPALEVEMPSSPPISNPSPPPQLPTNLFSNHMRSNSTETPADQLSSFRSGSNTGLNVQQAIPQASLTLPEPAHRPSLSPIVRAGQRLQQVTSDPPSPPARDNALGSPFRGSVTKSSQSPAPLVAPTRPVRSPARETLPEAQEEERSWSNSLRKIRSLVSDAASALSPHRRASIPGVEQLDDPFGPDSVETARSGVLRNTLFSPAKQVVDRDATISATGSPRATSVHDDDAMSWQGESSPVREPPPVEEQRFASPTSSVFAAHGSFLSSREPEEPEQNSSVFATHGSFLDNQQLEEIREDPPFGLSMQQSVLDRTSFSLGVAATKTQVQQPTEEEDEEEDLFLLEAQRPTPFVAKHIPAKERPIMEPSRRTTIADSWRRRDRDRQERQRPANNDENRPLTKSASTNEDPELSLLSQGNESRTSAPSRPLPAPATAKKQPVFSDFFSPLATLPPNSQTVPGVPGIGVFAAPNTRRADGKTRTEQPVSRSTAAVRRLQTSTNSLFPEYVETMPATKPQQIPQKRLEIGTRRPSIDLFSPVRRAAEPKPVEPIPIKQASRSRGSPVEEEDDEEDEEVEQESPLPARNPPRRNSLFGAISSIPKLLSLQRPQPAEQEIRQAHGKEQERLQPRVSQDHEQDYQQASELINTTPHRPEPRHRAVSPSKSCLRSPAKGKTPGRVVEFTSSTLSPVTQFERRRASRTTSIQVPPFIEPPVIQAERRAESRKRPSVQAASVEPSSSQAEKRAAAEKAPVAQASPVERPTTQADRHTASWKAATVQAQSIKPSELLASVSKAPAQQVLKDKPLPPLPPPTEEDESPTAESSSAPTEKAPPVPSVQLKPNHKSKSKPHSRASARPALTKQVWTNSHWELLAYILKLRRQGQLSLAPSSSSSSSASKLLGKVIGKRNNPDREHIVLEQWHIDIIHAFKSEMESPQPLPLEGTNSNPSSRRIEKWDELDLAKRLFAVILGEQRRREGKVDRERRLPDGRYPEDLV
ncbi:hypothetical protein QBC43DRAFT_314010 [Cladorrhinum sp. PSN259]|nr:hypothetical protein QBC43DRAFT_314010 [Cladorrhinum sp. PSN259]